MCKCNDTILSALRECLPHFEHSAERTLNNWRASESAKEEAKAQLIRAKEYRAMLINVKD